MSDSEAVAPVARPQRVPCAQCGADLEFRPGTDALVCGYCGLRNEIAPADRGVAELDLGTHLARLAAAAPVETAAAMKCLGCAAEITRPEHVAADDCPFCGLSLVSEDKSPARIAPGSVLPFHVTHEQAWQAYRQWIRGRWFAPTAMKRFAQGSGRLHGVYIPFWTFDALAVSTYTGQRGDSYTVTVGSGKSRRTERRTRWTAVSGTVSNRFDDLLIAATRRHAQKFVDRLDPWDLENLVPYEESYLRGMLAERYEIGLEDGYTIACERMEPVIRAAVRGDIGGDQQQIHDIDTSHSDLTFKHLLLPMWTSAYRYRGRAFRLMVNGRTGEVQGERPWSPIKIAAAVAAALAVVAVLVFVLARG